MAGIDMLSKFYAGADHQRAVGTRIKAFVHRFIFEELPSEELFADVLYVGCRNPMLHSFTLHNKRYSITLASGFKEGVVRTVRDHPDLFVISIEGLFVRFIHACRRYGAALSGSPDLRRKFIAMFPAYASVDFQSYVAEPVPLR